MSEPVRVPPVHAGGILTRFDPTSAVLALLERDFATEVLPDRLGLGGDLPCERLERVLLGPAQEFLARPGKGFRARLVELGWALGGATEPLPVALPLALEVLHAGSLIVDDIQDGSSHRRGRPALHRELGPPLALNVGNWLYFWAFSLIQELALPAERELDVRRRIDRVLGEAHLGQALDVGVPVFELAREEVPPLVRSVSRLKTGRLIQLAASIGPAAAGAPRDRVAALERFGMALGVGLQMLDDLGDLKGVRDPTKRYEDLRLGRPSWAWAWLAEQLPAAEFASLQQRSRRVVRHGEPVAGLARELRESLDGDEAATIHAHLEAALGSLERALGAEVKLEEVRELMERLESSYV